jgi:hypoxanthine phosphoribosyltransferase
MKTYTHVNFQLDLFLIERQMIRDNFLPHVVIGVARGGIIPAACLAHRMSQDINVNVESLTWQTRDGSNKDHNHLYNLFYKYKHKQILIVDDIVDSGKTFKQLQTEIIKTKANLHEIKFASLIFNTSQKEFACDYYGRQIDRNTDTEWIKFWWEE